MVLQTKLGLTQVLETPANHSDQEIWGSEEESSFKTVLQERMSIHLWTFGSTEILNTAMIMRGFSLFSNIFSWRFLPKFRDLSIC